MRRFRQIWILFPMLFGLESMLAGQAMVEHALGTSGAATTAAPAGGLRKAVSGIMDSLGRILKTGQAASDSGSGASQVVGPVRPAETAVRPGAAQRTRIATPAPVVPARTYEDPTGIRAGMANDELIRRFGPPALQVTGASSGRTLTYLSKKGVIHLEVQDDKVVLVAAMNPQQAAVVLPVVRRVP